MTRPLSIRRFRLKLIAAARRHPDYTPGADGDVDAASIAAERRADGACHSFDLHDCWLRMLSRWCDEPNATGVPVDSPPRSLSALLMVACLDTRALRARDQDIYCPDPIPCFARCPRAPAPAAYRHGHLVALAQAIYDTRDTSLVGMLSDAITDAAGGYAPKTPFDRAAVLHLQSEPTHYRGCWVIDTILRRF